MKTLPQKVQAVMRVYSALDRHIDRLQSSTGMHCPAGCGQCCKKPDIEASPIEFLPLALAWLDEGILWEQYHSLQKKEDGLCFVFRPSITKFGGLCNAYDRRGLICRLFGYSARLDKDGKKELVTCKKIKEEQPNAIQKSIVENKTIPVMTHYYSRMASIDMQLNDRMPINQAMMKAIETVGAYYAYRKRRKKHG
jgi:Fe-S-cluster containining protein